MPKRVVQNAKLLSANPGKFPAKDTRIGSGNRTYRVGYDGSRIHIPKLDLSFLDEATSEKKSFEPDGTTHIMHVDEVRFDSGTFRFNKPRAHNLVPILDLTLLDDTALNSKLGQGSYRVEKEKIPSLNLSFLHDQPRNDERDLGQGTYRVDNKEDIDNRTFRIAKVDIKVPPLDLSFLDDVKPTNHSQKTYRVACEELDETANKKSKARTMAGFIPKLNLNFLNEPEKKKLKEAGNESSLCAKDEPTLNRGQGTYRVQTTEQQTSENGRSIGVNINGIEIPPLDLSFLDDSSALLGDSSYFLIYWESFILSVHQAQLTKLIVDDEATLGILNVAFQN